MSDRDSSTWTMICCLPDHISRSWITRKEKSSLRHSRYGRGHPCINFTHYATLPVPVDPSSLALWLLGHSILLLEHLYVYGILLLNPSLYKTFIKNLLSLLIIFFSKLDSSLFFFLFYLLLITDLFTISCLHSHYIISFHVSSSLFMFLHDSVQIFHFANMS